MDNPRSKKDEIKADPEGQTGSIVLHKTSYLKHMKPVETSEDYGAHWQRSSRGARRDRAYDWFVQVDLYGKRGNRLHDSSVVVDMGLATVDQINDSREFWSRFDVAMHNYLRWRTDWDTFGVIGHSIVIPRQFSPSDISKIVIVRRFRHKQDIPLSQTIRVHKRPKSRVPFTEQQAKKVKGKGVKPPDLLDEWRARQKQFRGDKKK